MKIFLILFAFFTFAGSKAHAVEQKKPEIIRDSFGNDWTKWDKMDIFLSLPDHLVGLSLKQRAQKLSDLKVVEAGGGLQGEKGKNADEISGTIKFGDKIITFRPGLRDENTLTIYLTVEKPGSNETWRLERKPNEWDAYRL